MSGTFPRNSGPMLASLRCGARTRAGKPCSAPAVDGRTRCRMHGGAQGSGAPPGNQNAVTHGLYTKAAIEERKQLRTLMRDARKLVHSIA